MHFTSKYDALKYIGKSKTINKEAFDNRKEKQLFEYFASKMESTKNALHFCVFNFLESNNWLYDEYEKANDVFLNKRRFYSTFTKNIEVDYEYIKRLKHDKNVSFSDLVKETRSGNKPPLLQAFLNNHISAEFICLLSSNGTFLSDWRNKYMIDPYVSEKLFKLDKYTAFVKIIRHG